MKYLTYYILIIVGLLMAIGTSLKLLGIVHINSDWFWFLAGIGLYVEGIVTLIKQKKFDEKYIIIPKNKNRKQKF